MRWLDELNGTADSDQKAAEIKTEICRIRKEPNSLQNRRHIKKLYEQLDSIQFKPDYLCIIMDRVQDYTRACRGFTINGIRYHRLLGTNGGIKNETIVFISDRHGDEIRRRIDNGRDTSKELVAAKLESYKALTCSASIPVSQPNGIIIVKDCETKFLSDIVYLDDESDGEPFMESRRGVEVELTESDGYGLILPSLADRWATEMKLDYRPSGMNTRFSWEKGMVFCFDFLEFAEKEARSYMVKDAWGDERDIRDAELILTTSMVKLWDSYTDCDHYLKCCADNHYSFGVAKICPKELESERNLNYQFVQSYSLNDSDIDELIAPTVNEIDDILNTDYIKTILFLKGTGLTATNVERLDDDYAKALMIEPRLLDDPYIKSKIFRLIKNRINEAKVGVIKVHGNYSIVSGDPFALCQSIFGMTVTGILKAGEIYNGYWCNQGASRLACFRAPMTCHNNIRSVKLNRSEQARHWYQYMDTCTVFNAWDTAAHALNGMDKDGDLVLLTDNRVLVENLRDLPALMCVQRKAKKKIVGEADSINANIASFGDDIGKTTNRITSMFEVQSRYTEDSVEYKILDYRIKCGQLFQQNAIDKAKGIIAKPMPKEWFDRHSVMKIEDPHKRSLYLSILADKKPYFMRYIYPDLMKQYNTYIKNTEKKSQREFGLSVKELLELSPESRTESQNTFIHYYLACMPVGTGNCVTNRICCRFEAAFDGYVGRHRAESEFDYTIMKTDARYSRSQFDSILSLFEDYNHRLRDLAVIANKQRIRNEDIADQTHAMRVEFRAACDEICPNAKTLCDILLDICYKRSCTKHFVWDLCGGEIVDNLLQRNNGYITFPTQSPDGPVSFCGKKFTVAEQQIGGAKNEHYFE